MLLLPLHSNIRCIPPILLMTSYVELIVLVCAIAEEYRRTYQEATLTFGKVQEFINVTHSIVLSTVHGFFENIRMVRQNRVFTHDDPVWMG